MAESLVVQLLRSFREALLRQEAAQMQAMAARWLYVEQALQSEIDGLARDLVAEKAAGKSTSAYKVYRMQRYQALLGQLKLEVRQYEGYAAGLIRARQLELAGLGVEHARQTIAVQAPGLAFEVLPVESLRNLTALSQPGAPLARLLAQSWPDAVEGLTNALVKGVALGWGPARTAALMRQGMAQGLNRALVIARDQQLRAYRAANDAQFRESGVVTHKRRIAAKDSNTCMACLVRDGELLSIDEPGYDHVAGRCLAPGTAVSGPPPVGFVARHYEGDIVRIRTAAGKLLAVTPNHPVLTDRGWVAAQFLKEGDDVISDGRLHDAATSVSPDEYQVPTLVEEIPGALRMNRLGSMPGTTEDFHGDGGDGQVYVVWANRLLRGGLDTAFGQPLPQQSLGLGTVGHMLLARLGNLAAMGQTLLAANSGFLSDLDAAMVLFYRGLFGQQAIGGSLVAATNAGHLQPYDDWTSGHTVGLSQGILGFAGQVAGDDLGIRQIGAGASAGTHLGSGELVSDRPFPPQPTGFEGIRQSLAASVKSGGDALRALARNVSLDRVLEVSCGKWSGQVYNLQTSVGWYIANGIVTHNCAFVPVVEGVATPQWQKGPTWFRAQPAATQRQMLGLKRYQAWKEGRFAFEDLARDTHDATWGRGLRVTPLKELVNDIDAAA